MASRMTIINQSGHRFPLVKMEMKQRDLPEREEDIQLLLKGYFVSCIEELLAKFESIEPDAIIFLKLSLGAILFCCYHYS
jgi:hypothetical protein